MNFLFSRTTPFSTSIIFLKKEAKTGPTPETSSPLPQPVLPVPSVAVPYPSAIPSASPTP